MKNCELEANQKWTMPAVDADNLELILHSLREHGEVHIQISEGTYVPSLATLMSQLFHKS